MPIMTHPDADEPVNVSEGCVETMQRRGWTLRDDASALNTDTNNPLNEETQDGES